MKTVRNVIVSMCLLVCIGCSNARTSDKSQVAFTGDKATPRINYAIEQVRAACDEVSANGNVVVSVQGVGKADNLKPEGFRLKSLSNGSVEVIGADQSGVLYGCLELADRIRKAKALPADLDLTDAPEFKLRGPAIGMQKLKKDPYGGHYHWPYKPEYFPFFYDKAQWREYLDFLVSIRMNSLYLWNGHPFSSLVKLDDYPEALEVSPEVLEKNREVMSWLTSECDKRGIWLIQMFYNIHLPKKLGLGTQLRRSNPKAADYTRKSIAKFVEEYPNVGFLICLGEALSGKEAQVEWFTETIIPGVKDGLKARGQTELPPLVVRGHHIVESGAHEDVLSEGKKLYPNLFSMVKYNGESLTTETPRGKYQQFHKDMAKYSGTHMANVHLLSNLEPFRYADFSFIWNSAKAIRDRLDGNGLHLYPLAYWDWPNTPDTADITQVERDRLWFEIWARYSWKLDRDPAGEREHWIGRLTELYGDRKAAEGIYEAYDASGECAPRLLRRFGITGGNRQCLELGMFLRQLTDPKKYRVWQELYDSDSPPGETITQYINNEYANKPHVGETPPQIIKEVLAFAAKAVEQIEMAAPHVKKNKEEFERLRNDMHCIEAMTKSYCAKVQAAMMVHRYRRSKDTAYMKKALPLLEESLVHYKKLEELTRDTYRYSNTFHGRQMVPKPKVYHWTHLLGDYKKELADFKKKVANIGKPQTVKGWRANRAGIKPWPAAKFKLLTQGVETYEVKKGAKVFTDRNYALNDIAPQLVGLTGMRFSHQKAKRGDIIKIDFEVTEPVRVLVGYFDSTKNEFLQVPALEHVAHANERGGLDPVLEDVADIGNAKRKQPKVNIHAFKYEKGKHTLEMIGNGSYVILGVIPASAATIAADTIDNDWQVSNPVLSAGPEGSFDEVSVKDPSVVFYKGRWHVFYTARSKTEYTTGYVSARQLPDLHSAKRHELKMIRGQSRYGCAPQVFYYQPQRKWYLIFQNRDSNYQPMFSTTETISEPDTWSDPKPLLAKDTQAKWIDFWVICDKTKAYLFYTQGHNGVMVRSTSLEKFPGGWSKSKKVFDNIHEAVHVYKVKGRSEYHMIYELNQDGIRSFGLASATHLEGPWKKATDRYATAEQLCYGEKTKQWTQMVSHGEAIRSGYNELMEYDPKNCRWLIQGILKKDSKGPYPSLPWKLGIINKVESGRIQDKPVTSKKSKLVVLSEHQGPVIGPDHPDVKASGNRSGFETGQLVKHKGVYHMFVNEMFGQHHIDMRVSHWSSSDAVNWKRQSTVVDRVPGRSHKNLRSEVWLTGVKYNEVEEAWNIFFVSYRGGNSKAGEIFGCDYEGKIWRGRSTVKGPDGIAGPYKDVEIILQPDENSQKWEGQQAVDSFNPYKAGDKWYGFYGGHYHTPRGPWPVGLAVADKLSGPWKRMPEGFNPVPIVKIFIENPIVSQLPDGRYLAIFDSLGNREIGYSISKDGITWPLETRLTAQTGGNTWAGTGDHDMRTALCSVREDDGTFTVVYTAKMKDKGFWAVGKCTLGWEDSKK